ncbi:MAG: ABC transporter substrate-binding protein [Acidimicrobiales bacterium]
MRLTRCRRLLFAATIFGLVAAACGGDDSEGGGPAEPGVSTTAAGPATTKAPVAAANAKPLVIAIGTEPATIDAQAVIDRSSRVFTGNVFETLLSRDRDAKIVPMLALSYSSVSDNTWRFVLRQGVKFHNGEDFNAEAAAYSVNRIISKDYKTLRTSYITGITGAKVVDAYTVDITTDGINAVLPIQMTSLAMVPPKAAAEASFFEKPVGTGPYQFVSWDRGRQITAKRFDGYWGTKPTTADFIVRIIPNAQTALSALQTGEVDLVLDLLPEQKSLAPKAVSVPATEFSYIAFNTYKPELKDPRVRLAINMAIDKDLIAKTIYGGEGTPSNAQMISKGMLGFNSKLTPIKYDVEGAKKLLADAGYPNGFSLTLNTPRERYLKGEETSAVVAEMLKKVNITATVNLIEFTKFQTDGRIAGDKPGAFDLKYAWNSNEWFDASRLVAHITCKGTSSKYCNAEVDQLMTDAVKTLDQAKRQTMYERVYEIMSTDPYTVYLLQQNLIYGLTKRLEWQPRLDDEYFVKEMLLTS